MKKLFFIIPILLAFATANADSSLDLESQGWDSTDTYPEFRIKMTFGYWEGYSTEVYQSEGDDRNHISFDIYANSFEEIRVLYPWIVQNFRPCILDDYLYPPKDVTYQCFLDKINIPNQTNDHIEDILSRLNGWKSKENAINILKGDKYFYAILKYDRSNLNIDQNMVLDKSISHRKVLPRWIIPLLLEDSEFLNDAYIHADDPLRSLITEQSCMLD